MIRLELPPSVGAESLCDLISRQSRPDSSDHQAIGLDLAERLIAQGSVWCGNQRLRQSDSPVKAATWIAWPRLSIITYQLPAEAIIYADDDVLVAWKPPGLNTCPSVYSDRDCLSYGVQHWLMAQGSDYQVNTINRPDRDTQGLVVFAKHKAAERALHQLFMTRQISKRYLAQTPVFADARRSYRLDSDLEWRGKIQSATTLVRRLDGYSTADQLTFAVFPLTGRTHQIRKHFAQFLAPIIGDRVYGPAEAGENGLRLACVGYRFRQPMTDQPLRISCWPQDW